MRGLKKYLLAVCVVALSGVLLAGCSGQASSSAASSSGSASASASASSASAQASTEELAKELEAVPGLENAKSVTIESQIVMSIDLSALEAAAAEASSDSASSASAEASSASSASAEASESSTMDIPTEMLLMVDGSQEPAKAYLKMDILGVPCEMYITGENVVLAMEDQVFGGTLADLEALGMGNYSSVDSIVAGSGASSFSTYKDAIKSITKETVNGESVYTVIVDTAKIAGEEAMSALNQAGVASEVSDFAITYTVGADGKLAGCTMDFTGPGFALVSQALIYDYDKTVVPDAPAATMTFSDLQSFANTAEQVTAQAAA